MRYTKLFGIFVIILLMCSSVTGIDLSQLKASDVKQGDKLQVKASEGVRGIVEPGQILDATVSSVEKQPDGKLKITLDIDGLPNPTVTLDPDSPGNAEVTATAKVLFVPVSVKGTIVDASRDGKSVSQWTEADLAASRGEAPPPPPEPQEEPNSEEKSAEEAPDEKPAETEEEETPAEEPAPAPEPESTEKPAKEEPPVAPSSAECTFSSPCTSEGTTDVPEEQPEKKPIPPAPEEVEASPETISPGPPAPETTSERGLTQAQRETLKQRRYSAAKIDEINQGLQDNGEIDIAGNTFFVGDDDSLYVEYKDGDRGIMDSKGKDTMITYKEHDVYNEDLNKQFEKQKSQLSSTTPATSGATEPVIGPPVSTGDVRQLSGSQEHTLRNYASTAAMADEILNSLRQDGRAEIGDNTFFVGDDGNIYVEYPNGDKGVIDTNGHPQMIQAESSMDKQFDQQKAKLAEKPTNPESHPVGSSANEALPSGTSDSFPDLTEKQIGALFYDPNSEESQNLIADLNEKGYVETAEGVSVFRDNEGNVYMDKNGEKQILYHDGREIVVDAATEAEFNRQAELALENREAAEQRINPETRGVNPYHMDEEEEALVADIPAPAPSTASATVQLQEAQTDSLATNFGLNQQAINDLQNKGQTQVGDTLYFVGSDGQVYAEGKTGDSGAGDRFMIDNKGQAVFISGGSDVDEELNKQFDEQKAKRLSTTPATSGTTEPVIVPDGDITKSSTMYQGQEVYTDESGNRFTMTNGYPTYIEPSAGNLAQMSTHDDLVNNRGYEFQGVNAEGNPIYYDPENNEYATITDQGYIAQVDGSSKDIDVQRSQAVTQPAEATEDGGVVASMSLDANVDQFTDELLHSKQAQCIGESTDFCKSVQAEYAKRLLKEKEKTEAEEAAKEEPKPEETPKEQPLIAATSHYQSLSECQGEVGSQCNYYAGGQIKQMDWPVSDTVSKDDAIKACEATHGKDQCTTDTFYKDGEWQTIAIPEEDYAAKYDPLNSFSLDFTNSGNLFGELDKGIFGAAGIEAVPAWLSGSQYFIAQICETWGGGFEGINGPVEDSDGGPSYVGGSFNSYGQYLAQMSGQPYNPDSHASIGGERQLFGDTYLYKFEWDLNAYECAIDFNVFIYPQGQSPVQIYSHNFLLEKYDPDDDDQITEESISGPNMIVFYSQKVHERMCIEFYNDPVCLNLNGRDTLCNTVTDMTPEFAEDQITLQRPDDPRDVTGLTAIERERGRPSIDLSGLI